VAASPAATAFFTAPASIYMQPRFGGGAARTGAVLSAVALGGHPATIKYGGHSPRANF
jgi:hypothetical protein